MDGEGCGGGVGESGKSSKKSRKEKVRGKGSKENTAADASSPPQETNNVENLHKSESEESESGKKIPVEDVNARFAITSENAENCNKSESTMLSSTSWPPLRKSEEDDKKGSEMEKNAITITPEPNESESDRDDDEDEELRIGPSSSGEKLNLDEDENDEDQEQVLKNSGIFGSGSGGKHFLNCTSTRTNVTVEETARDQNALMKKDQTLPLASHSTASCNNVPAQLTLLPQNQLMEGEGKVNESGDGDDETDDPETACTESFRQLKPFNYDLEPVEEGKKERLYKVLVVGELGAGKTSIIKRYVHQFFSQHYRATIGVDFALKVLRWDPDTVVRLQLWDIAGQERFGSMTRVYYKEAVGAFVVFDVTRSATLEAVPKWKADLDAKVALPDGRPIPTVLLANKSDQPKEGIAANREKMNEFCQQQGFSAWFETSAKDNINIDESANFLVSKILEMDKWSQEPLAPDPDKLDLTANGKHKGASSSNCAC